MNRLGTSLAFGLCEYPFVDPGEVSNEPPFTEQGGALSATVLPEVAEVHHSVFAYGLLFGWFPVSPDSAFLCKNRPFLLYVEPVKTLTP